MLHNRTHPDLIDFFLLGSLNCYYIEIEFVQWSESGMCIQTLQACMKDMRDCEWLQQWTDLAKRYVADLIFFNVFFSFSHHECVFKLSLCFPGELTDQTTDDLPYIIVLCFPISNSPKKEMKKFHALAALRNYRSSTFVFPKTMDHWFYRLKLGNGWKKKSAPALIFVSVQRSIMFNNNNTREELHFLVWCHVNCLWSTYHNW